MKLVFMPLEENLGQSAQRLTFLTRVGTRPWVEGLQRWTSTRRAGSSSVIGVNIKDTPSPHGSWKKRGSFVSTTLSLGVC